MTESRFKMKGNCNCKHKHTSKLIERLLRREPQAVPLPGVNVSVSLSEGEKKYINLFVMHETCVHSLGNFKRFEAIMQKAVREGNQEHNDTLNDAMTKIESHCLAPPRLQTFQPASLP